MAKGGAVGGLIGIDHEVPIAPFMPVMMFAILFGLSMDYEVFLISRIREEYLKDRDTRRAVADGLAKTARVITAAAAIMVVVFLAFLAAPDVFLKLFGIGLASAIFLDATLVRMVLVPAVMQLLGDRNWWIPSWLERILPRLEVERRRAAPPRRARSRMAEPTCVVVDGGASYSGVQGFDYFEGISAETTGARGLCMHRLEIPPGGSARPHLHEHHETAIYVLGGRSEMRYGAGLRERLEIRAGQNPAHLRRACRTCRGTRATTRLAPPCSRGPTRTSRRASSCSTSTAGDSAERRAQRATGTTVCCIAQSAAAARVDTSILP